MSIRKKNETGGYPPPAVLILGDFKESFHVQAWPSVKKAYKQAGGDIRNHNLWKWADINLKNKNSSTQGGVPNLSEMNLKEICENPHPIFPIPLSDDGDTKSQSFRNRLFDFLTKLNVVAIISYQNTENTVQLLRQIAPLDIPVLVTLASSTDLYRRSGSGNIGHETHRTKILRLIPNNEQQAQAIVARIRGWEKEVHRLKIFYYPRRDEFCVDLLNTIENLLLAKSVDLRLQVSAHSYRLLPLEGKDVLVFICYMKGLDEFRDKVVGKGNVGKQLSLNNCRVFLTDGCYDQHVVDKLKSIFKEFKSEECWMSYPASRLTTYIADAYTAVKTAWFEFEKLYRWPCNELTPFLELTKKILSEDVIFHGRYQFRGTDNIRGGYSIIKLRDLTFDTGES